MTLSTRSFFCSNKATCLGLNIAGSVQRDRARSCRSDGGASGNSTMHRFIHYNSHARNAQPWQRAIPSPGSQTNASPRHNRIRWHGCALCPWDGERSRPGGPLARKEKLVRGIHHWAPCFLHPRTRHCPVGLASALGAVSGRWLAPSKVRPIALRPSPGYLKHAEEIAERQIVGLGVGRRRARSGGQIIS
jgi:hypothetical protein